MHQPAVNSKKIRCNGEGRQRIFQKGRRKYEREGKGLLMVTKKWVESAR